MKGLKKISMGAAPGALKMVERYRLLNEPMNAESICRDILEVDPNNQDALVNLALSLTDQFTDSLSSYEEATEVVKRLDGAYARLYYTGIIYERRARAHFRMGMPDSGYLAYDWFQDALASFEEAEAIRPDGDDEAIFRWNAIVRTIERHRAIQRQPEDSEPQLLE